MKKNFTINFSVSSSTVWTVIVPGALLALLVGGGVGFLFVDRIVMPQVVGVNRDVVTVPAVAGMSYEQAREELFGIGLRPDVSARSYSGKVAKDCIVSQDPPSGEQAKKGRHIYLVVSKGSESTVVPDIRKMDEILARNELRKAGLGVGKVRETFSSEVPEKAIISVTPAAGSVTIKESDVDLVISKGPEPINAEVPNIVGENLATATKVIEDVGLKIGKISYQKSSSISSGMIVSQAVSPGSRLPLQGAIDIIVSTVE